MAEHWSGRLGFILATVGSAVGLGSIWKFPYEAGANGGGVFVLFYLAGIVLIVVPLLLVEFAIGRRGRGDAAVSIRNVALANGASPLWSLIGWIGVVSSFLILSFYAVIGGWAIAYAVEALRPELMPTAETAQMRFDSLMAAPLRMAFYQALFLGISAFIVARGVARGIELAAKVLMPVLAVLIVVLAIYSIAEGDAEKTLYFMFAFDAGMFTPRVALEALGLGFFSIGVGLGVMIVYAAYAEYDIDLWEVAIATIIGDTAISLVAGFAVFPIVFAEGLDPSSGPGLMFVTLPLAFGHMPFGTAASAAFFLLLAIAGLVSAISLLEMPVALLMRQGRCSRAIATAIATIACFVLGLGTVLSFNLWRNVYPLAAIPGLDTATIYDVLDYLTSNLMLPIGGLSLAILTGWVLPEAFLAKELAMPHTKAIVLRILLRYVVPAGIIAAAFVPFVL
ncbi:MAG: sodium-dependent transporter [Rhizobiales bacterium]|nr:sodium-dependent transporter [Hyphomicrobiales bacterium]